MSRIQKANYKANSLTLILGHIQLNEILYCLLVLSFEALTTSTVREVGSTEGKEASLRIYLRVQCLPNIHKSLGLTLPPVPQKGRRRNKYVKRRKRRRKEKGKRRKEQESERRKKEA